jgi:hypothetical protein
MFYFTPNHLKSYKFLFFLAIFLLVSYLYLKNFSFKTKNLLKPLKINEKSNNFSDLLWRELFQMSEEQKLIDYEILYKTFEFVKKESFIRKFIFYIQN